MTVNISKPSINIREKLAELDKPSGIAGEAVLRADSVQEIRSQIGAGRKNLIINGGFEISQRGDFTSTPVALTTNTYHIDRFRPYLATMTASMLHTSPSVNGVSKRAMKVTATNTAGGEVAIQHTVEALNVEIGQTYTLSVKAKSNSNNVRLRVFTGAAWVTGNIHTGGGGWETLTLTYTNSHNNNSQVQVFTNSQTVGDYFEFTELQMELGSVATDFEHRSYGEELALCQRYYERINGTSPWFFGHGYNNQVYLTVEWKVPKRVSSGTVYYSDVGAPASMFTLYGNTGSSGAIDNVITNLVLSKSGVTALTFYLSLSSAANTPYGTSVMWRLDSTRWIAYDAEI